MEHKSTQISGSIYTRNSMDNSMSIAPRNDVSSNPLSSIVNFTITDCEFAKEMSTSSIIVALRVAQLVLCLMGFFSSVPFIYVLCSQTAHQLHVNVRLSLISLTVGAVFACFQLFISAFYTLMQTLISEDACDFMVDSYVCALIRSPILFAIYSTILGSMVLAAERAIATIHFKTYESHGSVYVGITLVLFQWLIALGLTVFVVGIRLSPGHVLYCSIYISHPRSAIYSITMISVMETVALLLSFVLLKINQRKRVSEFINNSLHSLTERYQLQENIRMMQILIPTMTVHAVLSILCLIALFIFAFFDNALDGRYAYGLAPFSELILLLISMYGCVFPLFAVTRNAQLRQIARRALPAVFVKVHKPGDVPADDEQTALNERGRGEAHRTRTSKQETERDSDTHFGLLSEMWQK